MPTELIRLYSRMGDVAVIALCCVVFILLMFSYVNRTKSFYIFFGIVFILVLAAIDNIGYHELLTHYTENIKYLIYTMRILYHSLLFIVFFLFALYSTYATNMRKNQAKAISIVSLSLFLLLVGIDILFSILGFGFHIEDGTAYREFIDVFIIGYYVYIAFLSFVVFKARKLVFKRVAYVFFAVIALSVFIRTAQLIINEASLTTMTFALPVIAMLFTMHANPYNISMGTLDKYAMRDMVKNLYRKELEFIFMSMTLPDYVGEGKSFPEEVKAQIRRFALEFFRDGTMFQINNGQVILIARKDHNPDYEEWMETILKAFREQYAILKIPYKIVYGESLQGKIAHNEYAAFIEYVNDDIPDNVTHRVKDSDLKRYKTESYITEQLADIARKGDLDDPRVLVFAQPVYNISTKRYDTAEALTRLRLDKTGLVYPGTFVPIAEENELVHAITKTVLNKACQIVKKYRQEGYSINRISVNVSMIELKNGNFCDDIIKIIEDNDVDPENIAIELTESQNLEDFMIMKDRIETLHEKGIKFYLDDFGTGYSNMERIFELPFDIIKFDRSMVIASGEDKRSEQLVENLAKMFSNFNFSVLFEGVETNEDERRCLSMSADYLQGFKYSQPIPIDELHTFLSKPN